MQQNLRPAAEPDEPEVDPAQALNFRLDVLSSEAMKSVDAVYRRHCGLEVRQLRILRLVGRDPGITFSRLAEQTRLERALTSRIVTALTAKGLVERRVSGTDARQFHLRLTSQGHAVRQHADALGIQLEQLFLTPLSPEERAILFACLDKLTDWVRAGGGLEALAAPARQRTKRRAVSAPRSTGRTEPKPQRR